ncbi:MAG TPA: thiosulfohydrolase SoxB [Bradyrhizobium sp.]|jgi:sulfur-oxidizing protein SoxB|nr:thiosulfohydrolase SoxB [Bradyrhizobium sp.]
MTIRRRDFLKLASAAALSPALPRRARAADTAGSYDLERFGNARILHMTDTHAQLLPVYFREPSVNLGIGTMQGKPPHLVGRAFLDRFGINPDSADAYAFTFLDFEKSAARFGKLGGFAHLKTLIDRLRSDAGAGRSLLLDGGDLWQGSGLASALQGADMVEAANLLGIEAMTGHWEFTYGEKALRANLERFKGEFLAQNVFLTEEAAFNDAKAFDPASGRVFKPHLIRELGGYRVAVIGQAFPYVPIAHPRRFTPDWTFGIRDDELQKLVNSLRANDKVDAVVLLSHNGMDVDLKLASRVSGIDVILGGHTHDAVPQPIPVSNPGGATLVTNAGSSGKFLGVLDLELAKGRIADARYRLLPVFSELLKPDAAMTALIEKIRAPYAAAYAAKISTADRLFYRRGNFGGTVDQLICDALRGEFDAEIALSPGFRWGNSVLPGQPVTMEDVLSETAVTYPETYLASMTGSQIKDILEDVCDNLFNADPYHQQGGDMVRVGGFAYTCTPGESVGRRISDLKLDNGRALDARKSYKVAGWASVNAQQGKPVWDILARHLASGKAPDHRGSGVTLRGVDDNPGMAGQG